MTQSFTQAKRAGHRQRRIIGVDTGKEASMDATRHEGASEAGAAEGARLLIVDDNEDASDTLADLLRVMGYEVRCAADGPSAMAVLDEYRPQLALLDIGLPGEDGYSLASRMRADSRMAQAKLVALTGYGSESDRARAIGARFDQHLVKPVSVDRLLEVLQQLLH
jgi:CheY-like chemotaxis protein